MISKKTAAGVLLLIGLCVLAAPGAARAIANGDTVFDCETDLDLSAIAEDGDKLVKFRDTFSIPIADASALDLTGFDLQGRYGLYDVVSNNSEGESTNFIYIEKPEVYLDICHNSDLSSSLAGAKVKNTMLIAFKFFSLNVGGYFPAATVRVELTTPDGGIITGVPDADGVVRNLTNHALSDYGTYIRGVDISGLEAGAYTARAVWESPQDFADYAEDSNTVNFTVILNGISIGTHRKSPLKTNPFTVTISGSPDSDYYLYVEDADIAAERYPFIVPGQSSAEILNASPFPDSADPGAKALAESERAVAGGAYIPSTAAVVTTDAEGFCSVEFGTDTTTVPMTYFITVVDPADVSRIDQARVEVEGGEVTITVEGSGTYYVGETVRFSGTDTDSEYVYLFISGQNFGDGAGVALDNVSACASAGNYVRCPVEADDTWEYRWDTAAVGEAGTVPAKKTCTVYACGNNVDGQNNNTDKYHLSGVQYQTFTVLLRAPGLYLEWSDATVAGGDPLTINGWADGKPEEVKLWIFGENDHVFGMNVTVESSGDFAYTLDGEETQELSSGRYYVVVQHPAVDRTFNVYPFVPDNATDFRIANTWSSDVVDLGGLAPPEAAAALVEMINSTESDDISREAAFDVEGPSAVHAAFTASPALGVAPLTVRFADLSTNASAWAWAFGDGTTSADQNPTHTYAEGGNYTVFLSVNGGADTATETIGVLPVLFGDANDNGVIDQADTLRVLKQVVGMAAKPASGTERFRKTDVHRNGEIDIGDALFIAQYNVGLRGPWFGKIGSS